jgi:hypothetical protein
MFITTQRGGQEMEWTEQELQELNQKLLQKAAEDADFRKELNTNPMETIEKLCGRKLPNGISINVIEPGSPSPELTRPDLIGQELSQEELLQEFGEEDLEEISGGIPALIGIAACALAIDILGGTGACGAAACIHDAVCGGKVCGAQGGTL